MGDCNPACQKIIINSGLVAILAGLLADIVGRDHALYKPAVALQYAANQLLAAWRFLVDQGALVKTGDPATWNGCKEATEIAQMIADHVTRAAPMSTRVGHLDAMRAEIINNTRRLVAGELR